MAHYWHAARRDIITGTTIGIQNPHAFSLRLLSVDTTPSRSLYGQVRAWKGQGQGQGQGIIRAL